MLKLSFSSVITSVHTNAKKKKKVFWN